MDLSEGGGLSYELSQIPKGHLRCLEKAIDRTRRLLIKEPDPCDYDQIHEAKSILYAAIEQMGMRGERIFTVQRMLRELLSIVSSQYQAPGRDAEIGLQILEELKARTRTLG
ncbi:MAG: hypothetical protein KTQ49_03950 [Candidatus Omnitrophica bacterium]|nr:hypothetical protein [Candidatus Omnitrophota bacterium]